jgi:hypothetical protein
MYSNVSMPVDVILTRKLPAKTKKKKKKKKKSSWAAKEQVTGVQRNFKFCTLHQTDVRSCSMHGNILHEQL